MEAEKLKKEKGETEDNRSFIAKYVSIYPVYPGTSCSSQLDSIRYVFAVDVYRTDTDTVPCHG